MGAGVYFQLPPYRGRFFSDRDYGGRRGARAAARAYRDQLIERREKKRVNGRNGSWTHRRAQRNNKLGILGVSLKKVRKTYKGRTKFYMVATAYCTIGGRFERHSFSVKKYGRANAIALATAARREMVARKLSRRLTPSAAVEV